MWRLMILFSLCLLFTGCERLIELTPEEENKIVEEMADIILSEYKEENKDDNDKKEDNKIEESANESEKDKAKGKKNNEKETDDNTSNSEIKECWDYDEKIKIAINKYELCDKLPDDLSNYKFKKNKDSKILVVRLNVINDSSEDIKFSTLHLDMSFDLQNQKSAYKPVKTLLLNDLQFMNSVIAANKSKEAILLYEVPNDFKTETTELVIINYDANTKSSLKIKGGDKTSSL